MAMLFGGCSYNYLQFIKDFYQDDKAAVDFLRNHGVLPLEVQCPNCKVPCTYREDNHIWYCGRWTKIGKTKKRRQCHFSTTDYKGTFLYGTHSKPSEILCFVNHWLQKYWIYDSDLRSLNWSPNTSVRWQSHCSEVTEWWLNNQEPIGGDGIEVEIGETVFVKQARVFGGIERISKKFFIWPRVVKDKSATTLIPIIKQYIQSGSVIYSDSSLAYSKLSDEGYTHYVTNHKEKFVDSNNKNMHIQTIGRLWLDFKKAKRPGLKNEYFQQYFASYVFIRTFQEEVLHHFFILAARKYPPQCNMQWPATLSVIPQVQHYDLGSESDHDDDDAAAAPSQPSTSDIRVEEVAWPSNSSMERIILKSE